MTPLMLGFVIAIAAALAFYFAPQIVERIKGTQARATSPDSEAKVRRLVRLIDLIKELDAVGAKSAATKLKAAASTLIDEDFLA